MPLDEEAAILLALQMKAAAFSDPDWLAEWERQGPTLLTTGWTSLHPHLSLEEVARVTGAGFLVAAVGGGGEGEGEGEKDGESRQPPTAVSEEMGGGRNKEDRKEEIGGSGEKEGEKMGGGRGEEEEDAIGELTLGTQSLTISDKDTEEAPIIGDRDTVEMAIEEVPVISDRNEALMDVSTQNSTVKSTESESQAEPGVSCDQSHDHPVTVTDDEIRQLWEEHYNSYYWYCWQQWRGLPSSHREGEAEGEKKMVIMLEEVS